MPKCKVCNKNNVIFYGKTCNPCLSSITLEELIENYKKNKSIPKTRYNDSEPNVSNILAERIRSLQHHKEAEENKLNYFKQVSP
jgi:hypothetical protein